MEFLSKEFSIREVDASIFEESVTFEEATEGSYEKAIMLGAICGKDPRRMMVFNPKLCLDLQKTKTFLNRDLIELISNLITDYVDAMGNQGDFVAFAEYVLQSLYYENVQDPDTLLAVAFVLGLSHGDQNK